MIKYKNLYLVGTSHISKDSVKEVEKIILKIRPKFIALELDKRRFNLLLSKEKRRLRLRNIKELGIKGFLLNLIGVWIEKKMGKKIGSEPGAEMKKAITISRALNINLVLIDQDIKITLNKFIKRITRKEKLKFLKDLIFGKTEFSFNLNKVPDQKEINKIINKVKRDYPSFYLTIVKERNEYMAKNLYKLIKEYPKSKIVGIVGAGHEKEIIGEMKLLEKI